MSITTSKIIKDKHGNTYTVDVTNESGQGGEGAVYQIETPQKQIRAVKVLHAEILAHPIVAKQRQDKLEDQIKRSKGVPHQVVVPQDLAYELDDSFVGFFMDYVDIDRYDVLYFWSKDQHKANEGITFEDIIEVYVELNGVVDGTWKVGFTFGDLNPRGVLVLKKRYWTEANKGDRIRIVDADSMQFAQYLCPVYTMNYVDRLHADKINWNARPETLLDPTFMDKTTDSFIYSAMLFETITGHSVYDGWHTFISGRKPFLKNGFHVLHPDVDYPEGGVDFDQLPKDLQIHFEDLLLRNKRSLLAQNVLLRAANMIIDLAPRQSQPTVNTGTFTYNNIMKRLGVIIDFHIGGDYVYVLRVLDGDKIYTIVDVKRNKIISEHNLTQRLGAEYVQDVNILYTNYLLFGGSQTYKTGSRAVVTVLDINNNNAFDVSTFAGMNHKPIVRASAGRILIARSGRIMAANLSEAHNARAFKPIVNSSRFTDLKADRDTDTFLQRTMTGKVATYRVSRGGKNFVVYPDNLRDGEKLENWTVKFSGSKMLLIRETKFQGQINTRFDEFNITSSTDLSDEDRKSIIGRILDEQLVSTLDEIGYANGTIVYGNQLGINSENLQTGNRQLFNGTKGFAPRGTYVSMYGNGLMAIGNGTIATVT